MVVAGLLALEIVFLLSKLCVDANDDGGEVAQGFAGGRS
jgi:hypothetical protein